MQILSLRLPGSLLAEIESESRLRGISKSAVVRERLETERLTRRRATSLNSIADLIGSVDGLPADLSVRKKDYLRATRSNKKRTRRR